MIERDYPSQGQTAANYLAHTCGVRIAESGRGKVALATCAAHAEACGMLNPIRP